MPVPRRGSGLVKTSGPSLTKTPNIPRGHDAWITLLEVRSTDPTASSVAHIFATLPPDVERTTGEWPEASSRAFCVVRAEDPEAVDKILDAITEAGADTRVIAASQPDSSRH
jgi:hypothetical protein